MASEIIDLLAANETHGSRAVLHFVIRFWDAELFTFFWETRPLLKSLLPRSVKTLVWNTFIAPETSEQTFLSALTSDDRSYNSDRVAETRMQDARARVQRGDLSPLSDTLAEAVRMLGDKPVSILDFGGAFGEQAIAVRNTFGNERIAQYTVIETKSVVDAAVRADMHHARFLSDIPPERFDIVFSSGTLQCIPEADAVLDTLLSLGAPYVVLTRNCLSKQPLYFRRRHIELMTRDFTSLRTIQNIEQHFTNYEILSRVENRTGIPRRDERLWGYDYLLRLKID